MPNNNLFEPRHKEMSRHVISGVLSSGIFQIVNVLCQFGSVIFLSRLLSPADFGVFAMAGPIFGFVMMFQNLGLSQATVQKQSLTNEDVNAFFWLNVGMGSTLCLILLVLSPVAGWYYHDNRVVALTAALSVLVVLNALGAQHGAILQRRMEFRIASFIGTFGAVSGLAVSLTWAAIFKNYWAIYSGLFASVTIPVICVWIAAKWIPSRPRLSQDIGDTLKFGFALTFVNIASFLSRNMDNVLIGHRWGDQALGYYDRAYKLLLFPLQRIVDPIASTMVPVLSRILHEEHRYRSIFLKTQAQLTLITWPGIIWAIVMADILVPTLLGKTWVNAVDLFRPLAMAGLLQVINSPGGWLFITQRRSKELTYWTIFSASTCIASFVIGLPYGAHGVAVAYVIGEYIRAPIFWWYVTRKGPIKTGDVVGITLPQIICSLVACAILFGVRPILVSMHPIMALGCGLLIIYPATILFMLLFPNGRMTIRQSMDTGHKILVHLKIKKNNAA